jgi:hypothetical protein
VNGDQLALVLAASIPAAITTVGGIWLARATRDVRAKVDETHHSVTVNSHSSDTPTVLDRLTEVADLAQAALDAALSADLRTAGMQRKLEDHLNWSEQETRNIWRAVWHSFRGARDRQELEPDDQVPESRERKPQ